jgi:hypothetical protein
MLIKDTLLSFFMEFTNQRIIAKVTSATVILGTGVIIYTQPHILEAQAIKEIALFILGGATAFLFNKD